MKLSAAGGSPYLDDPRVRLVWIAPLSILLWLGLLSLFAIMMGRNEAPQESPTVKAQILEMAPAGGGAPPPAPPAHAAPRTRPAVSPPVHPHPIHHRELPRVSPHSVAPPREKAAEPSAPETSAPLGASGKAAKSNGAAGAATSTGAAGTGAGIGSGNQGARAIYAPAPVIPDDLRGNAFNTVAVAHFQVGADGAVTVTLSKPTDNPQLNAILLDALKEWRFFPAMSGGAPVASQFDLRIPITVQ
jgi:protein TonB